MSILRRLGHEHIETGFLAVDEGGKWYVSPTGTVLHDLDSFLRAFRPSDLRAFASAIEKLKSAPSNALPAPSSAAPLR